MKIEPRTLERTVDVEPLPEPRWARIEQALLDAERSVWAPPLPPPSPMSSLRAASALVLAAAVLVVLGALAMRTLVQPASGTPTRVETAANGSRVEYGESTVDVGPESAVRLV